VVTEKGSKTGVIVGVVIAVVVLALVGGGIWWMTTTDNPNPEPASSTSSRPPNPVYSPGATPDIETSPSALPPVDTSGAVTVNLEDYGPLDYSITSDARISNDVGGFYSAEDGMVFVTVSATVTYRGTVSLYFYDIDDTALVTSDGVWHSPDHGAEVFSETPDGDELPLWMALLEPGESASGELIYQIATGSTDGAMLAVGVTTDDPVMIPIGL